MTNCAIILGSIVLTLVAALAATYSGHAIAGLGMLLLALTPFPAKVGFGVYNAVTSMARRARV
jgi:hypothetical protein